MSFLILHNTQLIEPSFKASRMNQAGWLWHHYHHAFLDEPRFDLTIFWTWYPFDTNYKQDRAFKMTNWFTCSSCRWWEVDVPLADTSWGERGELATSGWSIEDQSDRSRVDVQRCQREYWKQIIVWLYKKPADFRTNQNIVIQHKTSIKTVKQKIPRIHGAVSIVEDFTNGRTFGRFREPDHVFGAADLDKGKSGIDGKLSGQSGLTSIGSTLQKNTDQSWTIRAGSLLDKF